MARIGPLAGAFALGLAPITALMAHISRFHALLWIGRPLRLSTNEDKRLRIGDGGQIRHDKQGSRANTRAEGPAFALRPNPLASEPLQ